MKTRAFTLVELLVVVAIIGILALIVITNMQNALIKSRVARSQADMRSMESALMSYRADYNFGLPPIVTLPLAGSVYIDPEHLTRIPHLTTPVNYLGGVGKVSPFSINHGYWFYNWDVLATLNNNRSVKFFYNNLNSPSRVRWMFSSLGPNRIDFPYQQITLEGGAVGGQSSLMFMDYNPTNGLNSAGLIQRHGE